MSDIIMNVSDWMRENVRGDFADQAEREVAAYAGMLTTKLFFMTQSGSRVLSPAMVELVGKLTPMAKEAAGIYDE